MTVLQGLGTFALGFIGSAVLGSLVGLVKLALRGRR